MAATPTRLMCSAIDVIGEGADVVCDRAAAAGVTGLTISAAYHASRDYLPKNPRFPFTTSRGGVCFVPDADLYDSVPPPARLAQSGDRDVLAGLCEAGTDAGLTIDAWVVGLHVDGLRESADGVVNAFGDVSSHELCPARPAVRRYLHGLVADVGRYPVDTILAEAFQRLPAAHGQHHERGTDHAPAWLLDLLTLCFCDECRRHGAGSGVDVDGLRRSVQHAVTTARPEPLTTDLPALRRYLVAGTDHVLTLAADCSRIAGQAGAAFRFVDSTTALPSGATLPGSDLPRSLFLGTDARALAASGIALSMCLYGSDTHPAPAARVSGYRRHADSPTVGAIIRPMPPDDDDPALLERRLALMSEAMVDRVDLYHYGMMTEGQLEALGSALRG